MAQGRPVILLVDDESLVVRILADQLIPFEPAYEVIALESGPQALELVGSLADSGRDLALIIADQVMPDVSGVKLLEAAHRRYPDSAKILITGHGSLDVVARALNNAALDRYITKPWEEADLLVTVEMLLGKYRQQRDNRERIEQLERQVTQAEARSRDFEERLRRCRREQQQARDEASD